MGSVHCDLSNKALFLSTVLFEHSSQLLFMEGDLFLGFSIPPEIILTEVPHATHTHKATFTASSSLFSFGITVSQHMCTQGFKNDLGSAPV